MTSHKGGECVVYFDQHLGAAHSKYWSKYAFSAEKAEKKNGKKIEAKFRKLTDFLSLHPEAGCGLVLHPLTKK